MELKVKEFTLPEAIDFNFEELKQELKERMQYYENAVFTEDQTAAAKKDLALLRKFNKALSDERIRIKKQILKPYEDFEAKIKVLDGIVSKSINNIDGQLKSYEKQRREKKLEEILQLFNELETPKWLQPQMIFKDRWLNATVKMSAIEKEINAVLEQIDKDMATLADLPEYAFEAAEEYKQSLNLSNAIQAAQRVKETALKKAAAEQAAAEQAAKVAAPAVTPIEPQPATQPEQTEKVWLNFTALLSTDDAIALKDFFKSRNISFHKI